MVRDEDGTPRLWNEAARYNENPAVLKALTGCRGGPDGAGSDTTPLQAARSTRIRR